jgi:hypothetical protein
LRVPRIVPTALETAFDVALDLMLPEADDGPTSSAQGPEVACIPTPVRSNRSIRQFSNGPPLGIE